MVGKAQHNDVYEEERQPKKSTKRKLPKTIEETPVATYVLVRNGKAASS
jgi:hypothetical protein